MKDLTSDQYRAVVDHLLLRVVQKPCKLQRGAIKDVARIFGRNRHTISEIWMRANVSLGGDLPMREIVCEEISSQKKGRVARKQKYTDLPARIRAVPAAQLKWAVDFVQPDQNVSFEDMYDYVHVDEKWFHATRIKSRLYLLPGERPPHRSTQSKRFITKDNDKCEWFDGKIGTWHFTEVVPAAPSSRNRPAGTLELRPINVTRTIYKRILIDNVIPAIKAKWPAEATRSVIIQQDNARPHVSPWDIDIVQACTSTGWSMQLKCQPPNSPDLNLLDLGFFIAIQALQQTHHSNTYKDIVNATTKAWRDVEPWSLERNFLTLQCCLCEVIACAGDNSYKIPHMKKAAFKKCGRLPESVQCSHDVVDAGCTLLAQHDLDSVMRELSLQTANDLEMSEIFTALESLEISCEDEKGV
ncbi:hypothetical protein H257_02296 [Aphanomyces astaci]|uniref:Uncharacterized protein n=1 Tax=Aphanomyces astaci TaxID=112090 RepID=W4H282_APHAT|nr:hypothetical protein H257_02296 [Aphanomyces astaci]ETV85691.1 hypothetical protein H257_02296 [Aphanomyces astaci]|eukprot:XP_009824163.1 hypothetical protein H257_02296 [Aphanomyces astaci]